MTTSPYTPNQVQSSFLRGANPEKPLIPAASGNCDLDATKRDRFELLSAYLDGEVTPEERQQVLFWIQHEEG
ncbi:MAG: zf-HC2 domain-containing protein, partial [Nodosilinea sp.]